MWLCGKVTPCLPLERMQVEGTLCWLPFVDPEAVSAFDTLRLKSFVLPVHTWAVSQNHRLLEKRDMLNKTLEYLHNSFFLRKKPQKGQRVKRQLYLTSTNKTVYLLKMAGQLLCFRPEALGVNVSELAHISVSLAFSIFSSSGICQ